MTLKKQFGITALVSVITTLFIFLVYSPAYVPIESTVISFSKILQGKTINIYAQKTILPFLDSYIPEREIADTKADTTYILSTDNQSNSITYSNKGTPLYTETLIPAHKLSASVETISLDEIKNGLSDGTIGVTSTAKEFTIDYFDLSTQVLTVYTSYKEINTAIENDQTVIMSWQEANPQWAILDIDQTSLLRPSENPWPLTLAYSVQGPQAVEIATAFHTVLPKTNFDHTKLTNVAVTGVTAISRGVEYEIARRNDPLYPARGVMDILSQADITHINNENPLFDSCIPEKEGIVLCGKTPSLISLTAIGTDIVDLTGNHQNDYGYDANLESINHLSQAVIEHFGGGINKADAEKILYKTVNGTTFAFVGYNYFDSLNGPDYVSIAKDDQPGSNFYSEEKMARDILLAKQNADIVFVHFQFIETYQYFPLIEQEQVFRQAVDLGADVVVGVQSHQPQTVEFYNGSAIFYGLGNLFFDQMWSRQTRQGIIPWLSFYEGKLVNRYLYTTLLYDYSQPRFTNGSERSELLSEILN